MECAIKIFCIKMHRPISDCINFRRAQYRSLKLETTSYLVARQQLQICSEGINNFPVHSQRGQAYFTGNQQCASPIRSWPLLNESIMYVTSHFNTLYANFSSDNEQQLQDSLRERISKFESEKETLQLTTMKNQDTADSLEKEAESLREQVIL